METERAENKPHAAAQPAVSNWREYVNAFLAAEISALTRYYDRVIQWLPREDDKGALLAAVAAPRKRNHWQRRAFPDLTHEHDQRTAILINGTFNYDFDIQALLIHLKTSSRGHRGSSCCSTTHTCAGPTTSQLGWESARASCRAPS
jgi:hypothetical protein